MTTITMTETTDSTILNHGGLPQRLDDRFMDRYEKLSPEQAGHLRHFHNLATQPDGSWHLMGSQDPGQEWLDAYRYQLATMAYAAGAAHYHRMAALRSVFKDLMQCLISKMLRRDVWGYWFLTSHSGKLVDPDIVELRKPWADPIVKENIMVHDATNIADDVIKRYTAAWEAKGMVGDDGMFIQWYSPKQNTKLSTPDIGSTAWAAAFMNAWNSELAHHSFDTHAVGFLSRVEEDRVNLNPGPVAFEIRKISKAQELDANCADVIQKAMDNVRQRPSDGSPSELPYSRPTFGYVAQWVSELGNKATLDGLLTHADRYLNPTWQNGGLYYSPSKEKSDTKGNWLMVEPYTGNAAIGYARLNVLDGQRKMWQRPWTPEKVSRSPFIDGVNLGSGVDFLRGCWDDARGAMILTMRSWDGSSREMNLKFCGLPAGQYGVYHNGSLVDTRKVGIEGGSIDLLAGATREELNLVLLRA
ncbi:hypothetical protein FE257_004626 [Aspergillus nanangensis]|uniref:Linalool dehydratase/isomerase domain-containing protein n=1 Tax=Aspergillus nanangensis TaxID=2582783 RepID=A0AAD4GZE9_ASPNN|nr:hypothetical protein FE257_004626 [Aspergillus nanangensis]